jgi:hypothetical protein
LLYCVLPDNVDQADALGITLQDIDRLMKIKLAKTNQQRSGFSSGAEYINL